MWRIAGCRVTGGTGSGRWGRARRFGRRRRSWGVLAGDGVADRDRELVVRVPAVQGQWVLTAVVAGGEDLAAADDVDGVRLVSGGDLTDLVDVGVGRGDFVAGGVLDREEKAGHRGPPRCWRGRRWWVRSREGPVLRCCRSHRAWARGSSGPVSTHRSPAVGPVGGAHCARMRCRSSPNLVSPGRMASSHAKACRNRARSTSGTTGGAGGGDTGSGPGGCDTGSGGMVDQYAGSSYAASGNGCRGAGPSEPASM